MTVQVKKLKEALIKMQQDDADFNALMIGLDALETKISESEFVLFCAMLEDI